MEEEPVIHRKNLCPCAAHHSPNGFDSQQCEISDQISKCVVAFGEILARLSPAQYRRLAYAKTLELEFGGSEANVCISLAQWGLEVVLISRVPRNPLGAGAIRLLQAEGVKTEHVQRGGKRMGIYFLEQGVGVRASQVYYDRADSAFAQSRVADFDFTSIMSRHSGFCGLGSRQQGENTPVGSTETGISKRGWFHVSGITPALSPDCASATAAALDTAKQLGLCTSFDLNYRSTLWSKKEAQDSVIPLMDNVDVCIGNETDYGHMLGIDMPDLQTALDNQEDSDRVLEQSQFILKQAQEQFNFSFSAITLRRSFSASVNGWSALLYDGRQIYQSRQYRFHVLDRVGAGDAFSAGLIYALLMNGKGEYAVNFACAASALKHSIPGDHNQASVQEIESLMRKSTGGRIQR